MLVLGGSDYLNETGFGLPAKHAQMRMPAGNRRFAARRTSGWQWRTNGCQPASTPREFVLSHVRALDCGRK